MTSHGVGARKLAAEVRRVQQKFCWYVWMCGCTDVRMYGCDEQGRIHTHPLHSMYATGMLLPSLVLTNSMAFQSLPYEGAGGCGSPEAFKTTASIQVEQEGRVGGKRHVCFAMGGENLREMPSWPQHPPFFFNPLEGEGGFSGQISGQKCGQNRSKAACRGSTLRTDHIEP